MNRWTKTLIAALATTIALSGCNVDRQAQQQSKETQKLISDPTIPVQVQAVDTKSISDVLEITGEVTTGLETTVGAKLSGKLTAVYVKDGDSVSTGQLIASQDTSVQNAQLRQAMAGLATANSQLSQAISNARIGPSKSAAAVRSAQAGLRSAQANLKKIQAGARSEERLQTKAQLRAAKANLDTAQKDLERKQTLADQGAIPRAQLDQAQNAYAAALSQYNSALQAQAIQQNGARPEDIAVAQQSVTSAMEALSQAKAQQQLDVLFQDQVRSAQATVQSARAQVEVAQQAISDSQIRAPFSGRISGKPAQAGQIAGPGTTIATIVGVGGNYFEGDVPENEITKVQPGKPVTIRITAIPGKTFSGHVAAISPQGSDVGRLFKVRISLDSMSSEIKPGMFATGQITLSVAPNAVVVPATAIVNYRDQQGVWVMNGKDGVKFMPVTIGIRKDDSVQVLTGLAPGEKLIIKGQAGLNDKSKVKLEDTKPVADASSATKTGG